MALLAVETGVRLLDGFLRFDPPVFLHGLHDDIRFLFIGIGVMRIHRQTFLRTILHAEAALDARKRIDAPRPRLAVDDNRARRTVSLAKTAQNAAAHIIGDSAARPFRIRFRRKGIIGRHRRFAQIGQRLLHVN